MIERVHIGTSGWSYKDWREKFYPIGLKSTDFLKYYAQTFSCSEINSSFYHLPRASTIAGWMQKVPKDFVFCPKMSRYLTHIKRLKEPEESLSRFFEVFEPMKKQMGPVLIQLPPSLKFDHNLAQHFYAVLDRSYKGYSFALEGRHPTWIETDSLELMKTHDIALVISQSGVNFPYSEEVTSKNIYLRFHGPKELFKSAYPSAMLREYARKIKKWESAGHTIWAFFNNDWYTHAINNALELESLIR
jgi:uncharacterized protein YecE (DUF72 family)